MLAELAERAPQVTEQFDRWEPVGHEIGVPLIGSDGRGGSRPELAINGPGLVSQAHQRVLNKTDQVLFRDPLIFRSARRPAAIQYRRHGHHALFTAIVPRARLRRHPLPQFLA